MGAARGMEGTGGAPTGKSGVSAMGRRPAEPEPRQTPRAGVPHGRPVPQDAQASAWSGRFIRQLWGPRAGPAPLPRGQGLIREWLWPHLDLVGEGEGLGRGAPPPAGVPGGQWSRSSAWMRKRAQYQLAKRVAAVGTSPGAPLKTGGRYAAPWARPVSSRAWVSLRPMRAGGRLGRPAGPSCERRALSALLSPRLRPLEGPGAELPRAAHSVRGAAAEQHEPVRLRAHG